MEKTVPKPLLLAPSLPTSPWRATAKLPNRTGTTSSLCLVVAAVPCCGTAAAKVAVLRRRRHRTAVLRRISRCNDQDPLSGIPESAWPLLQRAEEAHPNFGWQQIAQGIQGWRKALENGYVWEEATWPEESLCQEWAQTLNDLELPRFTRRYPELIDALLFRLLEIVVQLSEAMGTAADAAHAQGGEDDKSRSDAEGQGDRPDLATGDAGSGQAAPEAQEANVEEARTPQMRPEGESLVQELMEEFREDWEPAVEALNEAEEAFGLGGAQALAQHFTAGEAPWHCSEGWRAARELRQTLAKLPELRKLVHRIGRRAAVKGTRRWLPGEEEELVGPAGVARSTSAPTQTEGLTRSGSVELMMPIEAHLLVYGRRHRSVRALHHSRRLEQSLLSYNRAAWLDVPTRGLLSEEMRPAGENGPLILCLDTSGSMGRKGGEPETVAKALVFECLRQAQQQKRRCYLFAFSTGEKLQEMELDLSSNNLQGLLEFLSWAFHGGTSLDEVLTASVERLHLAQWQNADLLLVTDGEVPKVQDSVMQNLEEAKSCGARVYGVVVGSKTGSVMMDVCSELYHFCQRSGDFLGDSVRSLDSRGWALRRVATAATGGAGRFSPARGTSALTGTTMSLKRCTSGTARHAYGQSQSRRGLETGEERADREQRWAEREKARRNEHEKDVEAKMGKRFQWVGGRWITKEEAEAQAAKIELVYQESRLGEANLELELKRHFQSRFLSPHGGAEKTPEDVVAAQWAEEILTRFQDQLLSLLVRASREASRLGCAKFEPQAALLGLFRCPVGKEICRQGLEGSEEEEDDVTERSRQQLERCLRRTAEGSFDFEDLPFSPELRHLLEYVEAERARLQHEEAQVGHLALALTSPHFRSTWQPLEAELGVHPQQLRPAALASLGGFFAHAEAQAEAWLIGLCTDLHEPHRDGGQGLAPVKGLYSAYAKLSDGLVERSVEAKLLLLAALAGEHLFLLGSPGTAKSLLARRLSKVCEGSYFERLLTRFTVPEELFGPLSLHALEEDELRRKTKGYLPECDVAFIDEIFKANSSILNSLLVILNERRFDNGEQRLRVPLWCAVAASNELPDSDELDALYDRFLLRRHVSRISRRSVPDFLKMTLNREEVKSPNAGMNGTLLSIEDSWELQQRAKEVDFPEELLVVIADLREFLAEAEPRFEVSDRRLARAVRLLRIAAAAAGGRSVVEADLLLLRHMFWDRDPEQGQLVTEWLLRRLGDTGDGKKAWSFLLEGLQTRLRHGVRGPGLDAAKKDLRNLQQAASRAMLRLAQIARDAPEPIREEGNEVDRFFWLSAAERRHVADLGEKCAEEAEKLRELLKEVSVLIQTVSVKDERERERLLARRLGIKHASQETKAIRYDEWGDEI